MKHSAARPLSGAAGAFVTFATSLVTFPVKFPIAVVKFDIVMVTFEIDDVITEVVVVEIRADVVDRYVSLELVKFVSVIFPIIQKQGGSTVGGLNSTGDFFSISNVFFKAENIKISAIKQAKLSSVNLVIYRTSALRSKATINRMKNAVQNPTQTRNGRKSHSCSLKKKIHQHFYCRLKLNNSEILL